MWWSVDVDDDDLLSSDARRRTCIRLHVIAQSKVGRAMTVAEWADDTDAGRKTRAKIFHSSIRRDSTRAKMNMSVFRRSRIVDLVESQLL